MHDAGFRTRDQEFYAGSVDYFDDENLGHMEKHLGIVGYYIRAIATPLNTFSARRNGHVRFLELGAGSCTTTLSLKKTYPDASFTCADISLSRMEQLIKKTADLVGVDANGIELAQCDISNPMPFHDCRFDVVVFDASLHHSCNMWRTLAECRRILLQDGAVAALREQYLAPFTAGYALRRLLQTEEVRAGVAENAYLKEQYEYYFSANGFAPQFHGVAPGPHWRLLSPLNGVLFSKWSIWAPINAPTDRPG
jgi:ubiquinone/menaquinone biosynthesis C-methylase UbiE